MTNKTKKIRGIIKEFFEGIYFNWLAYKQRQFTKKLHQANPDVKETWEGKFVNGDFFLKMKDGTYRSENSLRQIK